MIELVAALGILVAVIGVVFALARDRRDDDPAMLESGKRR